MGINNYALGTLRDFKNINCTVPLQHLKEEQPNREASQKISLLFDDLQAVKISLCYNGPIQKKLREGERHDRPRHRREIMTSFCAVSFSISFFKGMYHCIKYLRSVQKNIYKKKKKKNSEESVRECRRLFQDLGEQKTEGQDRGEAKK